MLNVPNRNHEFAARSAYEFGRSFLGHQRGIVAVIEVFMDESGIHDGAPAVTSSAVWARPSVWRKWTADWQKALHPIKIFHASECHGRKGEWRNATRPERDEKVLRLLPLFPKHKLSGRFAGVHLDAFMQCMRDEPDILREFGNPYFACIHWAFRRVCEQAEKHHVGRIAFVHEVSDAKADVLHAFDYTKRHFPRLQMTLGFGSKEEYVPLQAADLLAYEGYKFLEGGSVERKPMTVLEPVKDVARLFGIREGTVSRIRNGSRRATV